MKNLNIHNLKELFFNHRAAQIFFLTHDWKSIREVSRNYNAIHLINLQEENPKEFLLKLLESKKDKDLRERSILKNVLNYTNDKIETISERKAKKVIASLYKYFGTENFQSKRHNPKTYTNPMVQKYCTIFKKLGWVKERRVTKSFQRISKKGKVHVYSKSDLRMKMNLSQVVVDYITIIRKVHLAEEEERTLKLIFSLPTLSDFLVEECVLFDKNAFPLPKDNIAIFVEKALFRFLYIATSIKRPLEDEEIGIIKWIVKINKKIKSKEKKIEEIDEKIKDLPASSFCPILLKMMVLSSKKLLEKIVERALNTHLCEVIQTNLTENQNNLLL